MSDRDREAVDILAKIETLMKEYETLSGDKLLLRRIKDRRPQELWAWMNSLAYEYSVVTGKTIKFKEGPVISKSRPGERKQAGGDERSSDEQQDGPTLYCSFCGKSQDEVKKLIAGPTVVICDECVILCMSMIET